MLSELIFFSDDYKFHTGKPIAPCEKGIQKLLGKMDHVHEIAPNQYISSSPNSQLYRK